MRLYIQVWVISHFLLHLAFLWRRTTAPMIHCFSIAHHCAYLAFDGRTTYWTQMWLGDFIFITFISLLPLSQKQSLYKISLFLPFFSGGGHPVLQAAQPTLEIQSLSAERVRGAGGVSSSLSKHFRSFRAKKSPREFRNDQMSDWDQTSFCLDQRQHLGPIYSMRIIFNQPDQANHFYPE